MCVMARGRWQRGTQRAQRTDPCAAFRALALSMPGAVEADHFGRPSFRAPRSTARPGTKAAGTLRIFATLWEADQKAVLMLTPEQQVAWENRHAAFIAVAGKWGDMGATFVVLAGPSRARATDLRTAVEQAWGNVAQPARPAVAAPRPRRAS